MSVVDIQGRETSGKEEEQGIREVHTELQREKESERERKREWKRVDVLSFSRWYFLVKWCPILQIIC